MGNDDWARLDQGPSLRLRDASLSIRRTDVADVQRRMMLAFGALNNRIHRASGAG